MSRMLALALLVLAACPTPKPRDKQVLADPVAVTDRDVRAAAIAELVDEVLLSYERDEPPQLDTTMLSHVGAARIGVGPGDVLIGRELERAPSRWPLDVDPRTPTEARSKRLEVYLARDATAAWVFDEISWRIPMCGRTAVIPLRMTALFARDGDRWVPVFEHLSFAHEPTPSHAGELRGVSIRSEVVDRDLADDLSRLLPPLLSRGPLDPGSEDFAKKLRARIGQVMATTPDALVLGPKLDSEWRGNDVLGSQLWHLALTADDRRVGTVGRSLDTATVAYWIGNFVANLPARPGYPAGRTRMRGTFVFEKRCATENKDCRWVIVQAHVSQPIDDGPDASNSHESLAGLIFGTALLSPKPLEVTCDDGTRAVGSR